MSLGWVLQIVFDVFLLIVGTALLVRLMKRPKEDPRLSRGLQLLQSKISVLEDLSDRTEVQVRQLNALIDQKVKSLDEKIVLADKKLLGIDHSLEKSLEVAEIFQDRIPHKEIIERQSLLNYVTAARLAHAGKSVDEIARQVDLPRSELEFIAKVNKDRLLFAEGELPAWVKKDAQFKVADADRIQNPLPQPLIQDRQTPTLQAAVDGSPAPAGRPTTHEVQSFAGFSRPFTFIETPGESLPELGRKFKEACADFVETPPPEPKQAPGGDLTKMSESFLEQAKSSFRLQQFHPESFLKKLEEKLHPPTPTTPLGEKSPEQEPPGDVNGIHDNF